MIVLLAINGCSSSSSHDVKTFFFTGVPEPGQELEYEQSLETPRQRKLRLEEERKRQPVRSARRQIEPQEFAHGPFAAGACGSCHGVSGPGDRRGGEPAQSTGSLFVTDLSKLCIGCHQGYGQEIAQEKDLWAHGPVANGLCTECHDPHSSKRRYMLRAATSIELCTSCHVMDDLLKTPEHARDPRADCLSCHNPHLGKNTALLRSEFDEMLRYR